MNIKQNIVNTASTGHSVQLYKVLHVTKNVRKQVRVRLDHVLIARSVNDFFLVPNDKTNAFFFEEGVPHLIGDYQGVNRVIYGEVV